MLLLPWKEPLSARRSRCWWWLSGRHNVLRASGARQWRRKGGSEQYNNNIIIIITLYACLTQSERSQRGPAGHPTSLSSTEQSCHGRACVLWSLSKLLEKEIGKRDRPPYAKPLMQGKVSSPRDEQGWLGGRPSERLPCPMRSWYRSPECLPRLQYSSILQLSTPTMENSVCVLHGAVTPARRRLRICCRTKSVQTPLGVLDPWYENEKSN